MIALLLRLVIAVAAVYCAKLLVPFLGLPVPFEQVTVILVSIAAMLYVFEGHGPAIRV